MPRVNRIPSEALAAAKTAYVNCEDDDNCIEAACLAMLAAWPKANFEQAETIGILLPLTTEAGE